MNYFNKTKCSLAVVAFLFVFTCSAQQSDNVILQGFYLGPYWNGTAWNNVNTWGVPCPVDSLSFPKTSVWFYDQLATKANTIATSGFTSVWLPGFIKGWLGNGGSYKNPKYLGGGIYDVGYGSYDDYDLGDKFQQGTIPTRYGTREQLMRCIAVLHANGLDTYEDLITNQRNGATLKPKAPDYLWFQYKDAYGNDSGGRFPKYTTDFHNPPKGDPGASPDPDEPVTTYPNGDPTGLKEGFFGPDFAHIMGEKNVHGDTGVYCATELKKWADWLIKSSGVQGYRLDAASGISWDFLKDLVRYGSLNNKFSVSEVAGAPYSPSDLKLWLQQSMQKTDSNFTMFDQVLQGCLNAMCKTNKFWMGAMLSKHLSWVATNEINPSAGTEDPGSLDIYRSLMVTDPEQSVTVVNEVDAESPLLGNPPSAVLPKQCLFGYAYILTIGFGTPCISYKDWSDDKGCYGAVMIDSNNLNYHLNKLIWLHKFVCKGNLSNEQISKNGYVYAFQRGNNAMVFMNSNQSASLSINATTTIPDGTVLTDYADHNITATVSGGKISVSVPANINGRGYLVMAPSGISGNFISPKKTTTQEVDASTDLSIQPASNTNKEVCRIWVDANTTITSSLIDFNATNWKTNTRLALQIRRSSNDNSNNVLVASRNFSAAQKGEALTYTTAPGAAGFYSIWMKGNNLPDSTSNWWFNIQNTYTASQTIKNVPVNAAPIAGKSFEINDDKTDISIADINILFLQSN